MVILQLVEKVDEEKLCEVFSLAGCCVSVELSRDQNGKSCGHAVIEFTQSLDAVEAIALFDNQPVVQDALCYNARFIFTDL